MKKALLPILGARHAGVPQPLSPQQTESLWRLWHPLFCSREKAGALAFGTSACPCARVCCVLCALCSAPACFFLSPPAALPRPVVTALRAGLTSSEPIELTREAVCAHLCDRLGWSPCLSDVPLEEIPPYAEEFWLDCIGSGGGNRCGGGRQGLDQLLALCSSDRALSLNRTVLELGTGPYRRRVLFAVRAFFCAPSATTCCRPRAVLSVVGGVRTLSQEGRVEATVSALRVLSRAATQPQQQDAETILRRLFQPTTGFL